MPRVIPSSRPRKKKKRKSSSLASHLDEDLSKVRLAILGSASARKILIRDPKKSVATAVAKSRLTDKGWGSLSQRDSPRILFESSPRTASGRVIIPRGVIGEEPKDTSPTVHVVLKSLHPKDLKTISKDRDVPESLQKLQENDRSEEFRKERLISPYQDSSGGGGRAISSSGGRPCSASVLCGPPLRHALPLLRLSLIHRGGLNRAVASGGGQRCHHTHCQGHERWPLEANGHSQYRAPARGASLVPAMYRGY